jgi:hypothetical protein
MVLFKGIMTLFTFFFVHNSKRPSLKPLHKQSCSGRHLMDNDHTILKNAWGLTITEMPFLECKTCNNEKE